MEQRGFGAENKLNKWKWKQNDTNRTRNQQQCGAM